jgi:hypothetical protein
MTPENMSIQEAFRWIMRSIILVCGMALMMVVGWQASKWWAYKRTLGQVKQVVCVNLGDLSLASSYWEDFFSFWLLPGQRLRPYEILALEKKLEASGYFKEIQLQLENTNLFLRYHLSEPLALVGEQGICLYPGAQVKPALWAPEPNLIKLVGIESWNECWPLQASLEIAEILECVYKASLFHGAFVDARDWISLDHPASELVFALNVEEKRYWIRLGSVHCKDKKALLGVLERAYKLMRHKGARSIDLRLESVAVLGYEEKSK